MISSLDGVPTPSPSDEGAANALCRKRRRHGGEDEGGEGQSDSPAPSQTPAATVSAAPSSAVGSFLVRRVKSVQDLRLFKDTLVEAAGPTEASEKALRVAQALFNGKWAFHRPQSDPLGPLLEAEGVPMLLRRITDGISPKLTVELVVPAWGPPPRAESASSSSTSAPAAVGGGAETLTAAASVHLVGAHMRTHVKTMASTEITKTMLDGTPTKWFSSGRGNLSSWCTLQDGGTSIYARTAVPPEQSVAVEHKWLMIVDVATTTEPNGQMTDVAAVPRSTVPVKATTTTTSATTTLTPAAAGSYDEDVIRCCLSQPPPQHQRCFVELYRYDPDGVQGPRSVSSLRLFCKDGSL